MPEFSGNADKAADFQIQSLILDAAWLAKEGAVGAKAALQVRTAYVAHGAPITVTVKNREGKALQKIEGVVYADLFRKLVLLDKDAIGAVFFEAELPKHGLKATGPRLPVGPAVRLYDAVWKDKAGGAVAKVKRGMDLLIEAKTENIPEGAEGRITILERVSETLVKDLATVPCAVKDMKLSLAWRFEYPEDTAPISSAGDKKKTAEKYRHPKVFFEASSAGALAAGPEAEFIDGLMVEVVDDDGAPAPLQKVKITLPDGTVHEAESDAEGMVFVEEAAPGRAKVELILPPRVEKPQPRKSL